MTSTRQVALVPRDGLFVKDGRGWHTSALGRGHGLDWPFPSTILGALRAAVGRGLEARTGRRLERKDWERIRNEVRLGATLALRRRALDEQATAPQGWQRIWRAPADALAVEVRSEIRRLDPVPPPAHVTTLGRYDDPVCEALWRPRPDGSGKPEPLEPWWSEQDFIRWLAGETVLKPDPATRAKRLPGRRIQAHVRLHAESLTARDDALFLHEVIETLTSDHHEWALACQLQMADARARLAQPITLGAGRRLAGIEELDPTVFAMPADFPARFGKPRGLRLVLVTPAKFKEGWLPDGFEPRNNEYRGRLDFLDTELILRAAMVDRPVHMAGWDMLERKPKPIERLVPAGAVYFFERADGRAFDEAHARAAWLACIGSPTEEGLGRVVPGSWKPKGATP